MEWLLQVELASHRAESVNKMKIQVPVQRQQQGLPRTLQCPSAFGDEIVENQGQQLGITEPRARALSTVNYKAGMPVQPTLTVLVTNFFENENNKTMYLFIMKPRKDCLNCFPPHLCVGVLKLFSKVVLRAIVERLFCLWSL